MGIARPQVSRVRSSICRFTLGVIVLLTLTHAIHAQPSTQRQHLDDLAKLKQWQDRYGDAPDAAVFERLKQHLADNPNDGQTMYWLSEFYLGTEDKPRTPTSSAVRGVPKDLRQHMTLLAAASQRRFPRAQSRLASYFLKGVGVTKDLKRAKELASAAAQAGDARGHAVLAEMYETGTGVELNMSQAIQHYRSAAQRDYAPAMLGLGLAYIDGQHVPKSETRGKALVLQAATAGMAQAQYQMAILYLKGIGGKREEVRAANWMVRAAKQDYLPAVAAMGDILLMLDRTKQREAVAWFKKAADGGHAVGARKYGLALLHGEHAPLNIPEGIKWLEKASTGGDGEAQEVLGVMYLGGVGVKQDKDKAEILLRSAADSGQPRARVLLNVLKGKSAGSGEF